MKLRTIILVFFMALSLPAAAQTKAGIGEFDFSKTQNPQLKTMAPAELLDIKPFLEDMQKDVAKTKAANPYITNPKEAAKDFLLLIIALNKNGNLNSGNGALIQYLGKPYILTAYHVVDKTVEVLVSQSTDITAFWTADVVFADKDKDFALLKPQDEIFFLSNYSKEPAAKAQRFRPELESKEITNATAYSFSYHYSRDNTTFNFCELKIGAEQKRSFRSRVVLDGKRYDLSTDFDRYEKYLPQYKNRPMGRATQKGVGPGSSGSPLLLNNKIIGVLTNGLGGVFSDKYDKASFITSAEILQTLEKAGFGR